MQIQIVADDAHSRSVVDALCNWWREPFGTGFPKERNNNDNNDNDNNNKNNNMLIVEAGRALRKNEHVASHSEVPVDGSLP